jgi:hypothetical protein
MADLSVEDFSLLMHSLEREYVIHPVYFKFDRDHLSYFNNGRSETQIFISKHERYTHVSVASSGIISCHRPGFFDKKRKIYDSSVAILDKLMSQRRSGDMEKTICECIPSAKDIIAEKALINDHE